MPNISRFNNFNELLKMKYIFFTICVTFLSYQSINLFNEFMSGKTVTSISVGIIENTTMPAISVCPGHLDFSKLAMLNSNVSELYQQYLKIIDKANRSSISDMASNMFWLYDEALNIFYNLSPTNRKNININNDILENLTPYVNNMNQTILAALFYRTLFYGETGEEFFLSEDGYFYMLTTLPMESVAISINMNILDVEKCYTLFSHSQSSWSNIKMDFVDLQLKLYLDAHSFPIIPLMDIQIMMHSASTLPFENFNIINPGYFYFIKYSQLNIERLGKGYDTDCREYDPKVYTRNDCIFDCYQDQVKHHCHTQDFVGSPLLRRKLYFEQNNMSLSKCRINRKTYFESLKSCEDQCHKDCFFTYYSFTISKFVEINMYDIYLEFKHNEMPDMMIRYIAQMPLLTFICNFGGILGMWLGVSFVGILENIWKLLHKNIISKLSFINFTNNFNKYKIFIKMNDNLRNVRQPRIRTS